MANNERIRVGDRVTIYRRGTKGTFCADFWFDGEHHRTTLKTRNKKIATQRAVKLDGQLIDGTYKKVAAAIGIASAIESYLQHLQTEDRAQKTIVRYRGELQAFRDFCEAQRVRRLTQVAPALFDRFRAERKKNHGPKTMYHEGVVCKQFLNWCVTRHLIGENPLQSYKLQKPPFEPKPAPSIEEVRRILAASSSRRKAQFALLAFTGMRSGELQRLRCEDVDLENGWLHVLSREGAETKTRRSRKVPIHPALKTILAGQPRSPGPWFFTAEPSRKFPAGDHWINTKRLNEEFQRIAAKLKLPVGRKNNGYTMHSLRRFFETFTVNAGIPQRVVDAWQDHRSDRSMGAVYYRLSDEDSQAFMQKVPFGDGVPAADAGETKD